MLLNEVRDAYLDTSLSSYSGAASYSNTISTHNVNSNETIRVSTLLINEYKSKASNPETKSIFEPYNYGNLRVLPPGYSRDHETYRRMAELGASNETYRYASKWIDSLKKVVSSNQMWWSDPLVNLSMESEVVFEWWRKEKSLAVYILGDVAQYLKAWGEDIDNEMEDGLAKSPEELMELWKWLIS